MITTPPREPSPAERFRALTLLEHGIHLYHARHYPEALESFEKAIAADPTLTRAFTGRAHVIASLGRYEEAHQAILEVLRREPDYPFAYMTLGSILHRMRRDAEAREAFERAIELAPTEPMPHYNLACFLANLGDRAGTARLLKRALELNPRLNSTATADDDFGSYRDEPWFRNLVAFK